MNITLIQQLVLWRWFSECVKFYRRKSCEVVIISKNLINWILKFSSHYICWIPFTIGICSYANGLPDKWKHIDARWKAYVNMLYLQPDYKQTKITRVFHQWEFLGISNKSPWCVLKNAKICIVIQPKKPTAPKL